MGNRQNVSGHKKWDRMYLKLVKFKKTYGHCNVPKSWPENPRLGHWVVNQRNLFKKNKLIIYRIKKLLRIGFAFSASNVKWMKMYSTLADYKNVNGHCNVPDNWNQNPKLANWVGTQRYRYKQGRLSEYQIQMLQDIGFTWKKQEAAWNEMFEKLLRYKEAFGDCSVPAEWKVDPKLAMWVTTQRRRKRQGKLAEDRIRRLDEIGFRWEK